MRRPTAPAAALVLLLLAGCGGEGGEDPASVDEMSAVEQMEVAFNGNPRKAEIERALDAAFAASDTVGTEDNRSRAGSVLVTFRKEYGIDEMDILKCMPHRSGDPRLPDQSFASVAAVCVTDIATGSYP